MSVGCGSAKLVLASKWFAERKLATKPWQTQKIARGMMIRFSKKAVWSKQALFKFQNTQIMSNVVVMPICPHHRQYPGSVWAVKKYCFGIGINLDNNCYSCLAWHKTIWHDASWVWLGQIGICENIDVVLLNRLEITTDNRLTHDLDENDGNVLAFS